MSIPLRPQDIDVPENDPFKNDLLDRKETAGFLTELVRSIEGPGVVAIDAAWGTGKTTFLRMWVQQLRNDKFAVVEFNAWDTDFAADAFLAVSTELQAGLESAALDVPTAATRAIKKWSKEILRHGVPELVRLAVAGMPLVDAVSGKVAKSIVDRFTESRVSSYTAAKQAVTEFRSALGSAAAAVSKSSETKPLVVVVDELDRCRPTYAVELLETAKHLFSVDHIVFVLAINGTELSHSVKSLYGVNFDADRYLRRFFDAEVSLPDPDLRRLTTNALRITGLDSLGARIPDRQELHDAKEVLVDILKMSTVDARTVLQNLHVLGLVLGSTRESYYALPFAAVVATIVRIHDASVFGELTQGNVTDEEAVRIVRSRCDDRAWSSSDSAIHFEAAIMCIVSKKARAEMRESLTPLFQRYKQTEERLRTSKGSNRESAEYYRVQDVLAGVERMARSSGARRMTLPVQFDIAVARLQTLSGAAG